jgi:DNA-directed RNA polymerase specialized sigma subunit
MKITELERLKQIDLIQSGCQETLYTFIIQNTPLIHKILTNYTSSKHSHYDEAKVMIAMIEAVQRFDPSRETSFATHLLSMVKKVRDGLLRQHNECCTHKG